MAKVDARLEMWKNSHNLHATLKKSHAHTKQVSMAGYFSDTEEIIQPSWSLFQHDCVAAFELWERLPLPPAFSAKDLPGRWTYVLNISRILTIDHHPVESDEDSVPQSIMDNKSLYNWNGDMDNPNNSKDDCKADVECDIDLGSIIKHPTITEQRGVCTAPNVSGLIFTTWK